MASLNQRQPHCLIILILTSLVAAPVGLTAEKVLADDLYWSGGGIWRGSTGGNEPVTQLYSQADYPGPMGFVDTGLALDGEFVFWGDLLNERILRGTKDGSGPIVELYNADDFPETPGGPIYQVYDMEVDDNFLYWNDFDTLLAMRAPKDGSGPVTELFTSDFNIRGMALDDDFLYWVEHSGAVIRGAKDGSGSFTRLFVLGDYPPEIEFHQLGDVAVDDDFVYWTDTRDDVILRGAKDGNGSVIVLYDPNDYPCDPPHETLGYIFEGITIQDNSLYWVEQIGGQILRGSTDGVAPVVELYGPGASQGIFITIPEPSSIMLTIIPLLVLGFGRRIDKYARGGTCQGD